MGDLVQDVLDLVCCRRGLVDDGEARQALFEALGHTEGVNCYYAPLLRERDRAEQAERQRDELREKYSADLSGGASDGVSTDRLPTGRRGRMDITDLIRERVATARERGRYKDSSVLVPLPEAEALADFADAAHDYFRARSEPARKSARDRARAALEGG